MTQTKNTIWRLSADHGQRLSAEHYESEASTREALAASPRYDGLWCSADHSSESDEIEPVILTLSWGEIPADLAITEPYEMRLSRSDLPTVAAIVNQGIDSHLEAVRVKQNGRNVSILDTDSLRCFLRRCVESDDDNAHDLASSIMQTLGYEWI